MRGGGVARLNGVLAPASRLEPRRLGGMQALLRAGEKAGSTR